MRLLKPIIVLLACLPGAARAEPLFVTAPSPGGVCRAAIAVAEHAGAIPPQLMAAIGRVESGRRDPVSGVMVPWPWTINADGEGSFYDTKEQAIAAVRALQAHGVQSIDVGCMQINLMFHPDAFASLDQAFDPGANARFAARFLTALRTTHRDWPAAIAAYHSETPALGAAYRQLVLARWDRPGMTVGAARYADFAPRSARYHDFLPTGQVYGAFANAIDALPIATASR